MNPETEKIEEPFACFPAGTEREEIWHWFDRRHSKGVAYLLYGNGAEYVVTASELMQMHLLCDECGSVSCHYNHGGECRFSMVHERRMTTTGASTLTTGREKYEGMRHFGT